MTTMRRVGLLAALTLGLQGLAWSADSNPQIWFIRHAQSEINVPGSPRPTPDGGMTYPLTMLGVEQANTLAEKLTDAPISRIYASTQLRAVQTADAIAFKHRKTITLAPEVVEINLGIVPGRDNLNEVYGNLARQWLIEKNDSFKHGEGESFAEVKARFLPFAKSLLERHKNDQGVVAVVAHGATLAFMVPQIVENVPARFAITHPLPNTGIIKTELRDGKWVCIEWVGVTEAEIR
jgi:broad specificity phosphatase PhoE